mmetsp:Transcript_21327/g.60032  ORF Transcript_21327/g.60032 Transcript_21327/m.60032 type:complete len:153 (+) Transcript_21327:54-512(+)
MVWRQRVPFFAWAAAATLGLAAARANLTVLGEVTELAGRCFEVDHGQGLGAKVRTTKIVVWDADFECPEGHSYIHYTPVSGAFIPMAAEKGPAVHTYHAARFKDYNKYGAFTERCGPHPADGVEGFSWQVANVQRGGRCPRTKEKTTGTENP